jgi:hypothetical protein
MKQYKKHSTNNTKQTKYKYTYYQNTHTYTHYKQVKTTTVQIKTNTVQDTPKWNSHNTISTLSIRSPWCTWHFYPQVLHRNSLHFTSN